MKKVQQTGLQQGKLCVVPHDILGENAVGDFDVLRCGQLVCVLEVWPMGHRLVGAWQVGVKVLSSEGVVLTLLVSRKDLLKWKEARQ